MFSFWDIEAIQTNGGARNRLMDAMARAEEREDNTTRTFGAPKPKQKGLAKPSAATKSVPTVMSSQSLPLKVLIFFKKVRSIQIWQ
jgi:hypothetical protein